MDELEKPQNTYENTPKDENNHYNWNILKYIIIIFIIFIISIIINYYFSTYSKAKKIKDLKLSYEEEYKYIRNYLNSDHLFPLTYNELIYISDRINSLEDNIQRNNIQSEIIKIDLLYNILNNYVITYKKGTIFKDWETEEEISKNIVEIPIKFAEYTRDSIDYVYKVKNNTQLRAKQLYEKYGWNKEECINIAKGYIFMGMTKEQLIMAWGKPKDINRTVTRYSIDEQWVYGDFGPYVYLEDGVVTSWQD